MYIVIRTNTVPLDEATALDIDMSIGSSCGFLDADGVCAFLWGRDVRGYRVENATGRVYYLTTGNLSTIKTLLEASE